MNRLITQSLATASVHLLFGFPKKLMNRMEVEMVEWIFNYISKHGTPPTLPRFTDHFDMFIPMVTDDPITDTYEQTLTKKRNLYTRTYLMEIQDDLKAGKDPTPYIESLFSDIRGGDGGVVRYSTFDRSDYYRSQNSIPYGIPQLDRYTGGVAKGDLIYLVGRLGTGKTTVAIWVLKQWLFQGKKVLVVSNENRAEDVIGKIDSFVGGYNPLKKRTQEWTDEDKAKISTVSYIASNMEGEVFIPKKPVRGVEEVYKLVYTYNPDIVIIDGIYLIGGAGGDSHWEKITGVSRELKQLAEGQEIPVLGIHQANRNAAGKRVEVEHVAYADALAQDADLLLGVNAEEDGSIFVEALKNRWGGEHWGFFLKIYFDTMTCKVLDPRLATTESE